jgi:hypothetical protein
MRIVLSGLSRDEQRKFVAYNRNAGNIVVTHVAVRITQALVRFRDRGKVI